MLGNDNWVADLDDVDIMIINLFGVVYKCDVACVHMVLCMIKSNRMVHLKVMVWVTSFIFLCPGHAF